MTCVIVTMTSHLRIEIRIYLHTVFIEKYLS